MSPDSAENESAVILDETAVIPHGSAEISSEPAAIPCETDVNLIEPAAIPTVANSNEAIATTAAFAVITGTPSVSAGVPGMRNTDLDNFTPQQAAQAAYQPAVVMTALSK